MSDFLGNGRTMANPIKFVISDTPCGAKDLDDGANFMGAIGRINNISAANKATKGLQLFEKTVKAGGPSAEKLVNSGANGFFDAVLGPAGMDSQTVYGPINRISPSAVNKAEFSAVEILDRAKNGSFDKSQIPLYTRDIANLIKIGSKIYTPLSKDPPMQSKCSAPNYAIDLVEFGVKQNYRFMAIFEFNDPYHGSLGHLSHVLGLKTCDRPSVSIQYEDVNMYNYRTKVPTKTTYNPMTMSFYDDQMSQSLDLYQMYLKTISPIANMTRNQTEMLDRWGMNFDNEFNTKAEGGALKSSHATHGYSGSLGALATDGGIDAVNIIRSIRVFHLYRGGGLFDEYTYINPKITEMSLDQLDMAGGSGPGMVNFTFDYDMVNIETYDMTYDFREEILFASEGGGRAAIATASVYPEPLPATAVNTPGGNLSEQPPTATPNKPSARNKTALQKLTGAASKVSGFL